MVYTKEIYQGMIEECKRIAAVFIKDVAARRSMLDPVNNNDFIRGYDTGRTLAKTI